MDWLHYVEMGFITIIIIYLAVGKADKDNGWIWSTHVKTTERLQKLEEEVRYVADQPQRYYSIGSAFHSTPEEWEKEKHKNDVPITDVVKAIITHLDMEILKVPESTTKKPMEVKLTEKPKVVMSATGVVTMPDGSGIPMPKPKRKYTKRKTK